MGVPAVTGAADLEIDVRAGTVSVGATVLRAGDRIAIDGTTGAVTVADVPLIEPEMDERFEEVLRWADELADMVVRTNADTPEDAAKARAFGAQGIGLCRTEHMFLGDRQPLMADVILAETPSDQHAAIERLRPLQEDDFTGIFEAMDGLPVTIRLLDPPLHEFVPHVEAFHETNPMLGTRGVRLGILRPELYRMQAEAIFAAMARVPGARVEIMIPLVAYERELELGREIVEAAAAAAGVDRSSYLVGTMIELPRACFQADNIAQEADFFSFGTNDLTQTALGFSRDDIEARIVGRYIEMKVFDRSPFETLDTPGVGQLVRMGAWLGRKTKEHLKLGVCGEHGGDPDSIRFFQDSGIDYVSCSPYRVPVARIAAAQAAIASPRP